MSRKRAASYLNTTGLSRKKKWPHASAWGAGVIHSAMRSAFVVSSCMYEEFHKKNQNKKMKMLDGGRQRCNIDLEGSVGGDWFALAAAWRRCSAQFSH